MVLVHDKLSHCVLEVYEVSTKQLQQCSTYKSGQRVAFSYVTRGIIWKKNKQELWFLCMTCCLNVLYKCMKFR